MTHLRTSLPISRAAEASSSAPGGAAIGPTEVTTAWKALPLHRGWRAAEAATDAHLDAELKRAREKDPEGFDRKRIILCVAEGHGWRANVPIVQRCGARLARLPHRPAGRRALLVEGDLNITYDWRTALSHAKQNQTGIVPWLNRRHRTELWPETAARVTGFAAHSLTAEANGMRLGQVEPSANFDIFETDKFPSMRDFHMKRERDQRSVVRQQVAQGDCVVVVGMMHESMLRQEFEDECTFITIAPIAWTDENFDQFMANPVQEDIGYLRRLGSTLTSEAVGAFRIEQDHFRDEDLARLIRGEAVEDIVEQPQAEDDATQSRDAAGDAENESDLGADPDVRATLAWMGNEAK